MGSQALMFLKTHFSCTFVYKIHVSFCTFSCKSRLLELVCLKLLSEAGTLTLGVLGVFSFNSSVTHVFSDLQ